MTFPLSSLSDTQQVTPKKSGSRSTPFSVKATEGSTENTTDAHPTNYRVASQ